MIVSLPSHWWNVEAWARRLECANAWIELLAAEASVRQLECVKV